MNSVTKPENMHELKWVKLHIMHFSVMKAWAADNKLLLLLTGYTSESATHSFSDWLCAQQTETGIEAMMSFIATSKQGVTQQTGPRRAELKSWKLQKSALLWRNHCKRICLSRIWIANGSMSLWMDLRYNLENITAFIQRDLSFLWAKAVIQQAQE